MTRIRKTNRLETKRCVCLRHAWSDAFRPVLVLLAILLPCVPAVSAEPTRHALIVGINSYEAPQSEARNQRWRDLRGAGNDLDAIGTVLKTRYGFVDDDILTLRDRGATRDAILEAIRSQLVDRAAPGVDLFFFFSGHGSEVEREIDGRREWVQTLVPSDSWSGVPDIADLELRRLFNDALDKGARLTIMIDSCHSGGVTRSGRIARSLPPGSVLPDLPEDPGPPLADRGAVMLLSALPEELAQEIEVGDGEYVGAFTHLFVSELMRSGADTPLDQLVERVGMALRAQRLNQTPLLLASSPSPGLLGQSGEAVEQAAWVRVQPIDPNADAPRFRTIGGIDVGLYPGSVLRASEAGGARLEIVESTGLTTSEAVALDSDVPTEPFWAVVERFAPAPLPPVQVYFDTTVDSSSDPALAELKAWALDLPDLVRATSFAEAEAALVPCSASGREGLRWRFPDPRGVIETLGLEGLACRIGGDSSTAIDAVREDLRRVLRAVAIDGLRVAASPAKFPYRLDAAVSGVSSALRLTADDPDRLERSLAMSGGGRYFNLWAIDASLEIHRICPNSQSAGCARERVPVGGWRDAPSSLDLAELQLPPGERIVLFALFSSERLWRGLFDLEPMRGAVAEEPTLALDDVLLRRAPTSRGSSMNWEFQLVTLDAR